MNEAWRGVPGWEGLYDVSNYGRVRSLPRAVWMPRNRCHKNIGGIVLREVLTNKGYIQCTLASGSRRKTVLVHQLVASAFIGPLDGLTVNHMNGIKTDNRVENLEIVTHRENNIHSRAVLGLCQGEGHGMHKLTDDAVQEMCRLYSSGYSQRAIGELYGVSQAHVSKIVRRTAWRHVLASEETCA